MAFRAPRFGIVRNTSFAACRGLSCKSPGPQQLRSFSHGATINFRMASQYPTSYPLKSDGTPQFMTARFRSSIPENKNVIITPQSSTPASSICEKAIPFNTDKMPNSVRLSCGTDLMRDHVNALTKLTEGAVRLIIPFPHFRGYHDFTTLVNEEIKKTTFGGISVEESNRVISGLRQMLSHYENEAELLSMDVLENQPQADIHRRGNASGSGTSPPNEPPKRYSGPKVLTAKNGLPAYQCPALNTALQDLVTLREAAIEHATHRPCDFSLIIMELDNTIDFTRCAHSAGLTTLEKILEAKGLVYNKECYTEKLMAEMDAARPVLNARRGQNDNAHEPRSIVNDHLTLKDTESQRDKMQSLSNANKELNLEKNHFEGRIQQLEAEIQELHQQKKKCDGQIQNVEAANLNMELQQKGSEIQLQKLEVDNQALHRQKAEFVSQNQRLEAENLGLRQQKREYLLQDPPKEASEGQIQKLEAKALNLNLQMDAFEGEVQRLKAEKVDLSIQKKELEDDMQRLEAKNLEPETELTDALDGSHYEAILKKFDVVIQKLKSENEGLRTMVAGLQREAKEQLKRFKVVQANLAAEDDCTEDIPDKQRSWSIWKPSSWKHLLRSGSME